MIETMYSLQGQNDDRFIDVVLIFIVLRIRNYINKSRPQAVMKKSKKKQEPESNLVNMHSPYIHNMIFHAKQQSDETFSQHWNKQAIL